MINRRPLGIGIVGTAWITRAHAHALRTINHTAPLSQQIRLVSIYGRRPEAAQQFQHEFGFARATTDWQELVDDPEVDVIANLGTNLLHEPVSLAALQAGKPVLCEKPLAMTGDSARGMYEAAQTAGVPTACGFSYRFVPAIRLFHDLLESGRLGAVRHFRGLFLQDGVRRPTGAETSGSGSVLDFSHILDMLRHLAGEPLALSAMTSHFGGDGDDCYAAFLDLPQAGTATLRDLDMPAVVFAGPGRLEVQRRPRPMLAAPTDVLVAIEACGICGTDLHITENPPGHPGLPGVILGHEMVGRVADVGPGGVGIEAGTRVVVAPNVACHSCRACKAGVASACEHFSSIGIFRDGALADMVSVPASNCHPISDAVPARVAALTEPLSCVLNGVLQARPIPGDVALIYGGGAIGLLFLAVLTAGGVRCAVVEPASARRAAARQMGAVLVVDPVESDVSEALSTIASHGADVVVDAVGTQLADAISHARPRGKILLFGFNTRTRPAVSQSLITRHELTVLGTWVGDFTFPPAIRLQESGLLDLDPIVSHWLPLESAPQAFAALRSGEAVKAVLRVAE
jgi:threonine dehydrogenase-like Zn-dependent dehydrogenase